FGVKDPSCLLWSHCCNTRRQLRDVLHFADSHVIEVDVTFGKLLKDGREQVIVDLSIFNCVGARSKNRKGGSSEELILCHFPYTKSDLSLKEFLQVVCEENETALALAQGDAAVSEEHEIQLNMVSSSEEGVERMLSTEDESEVADRDYEDAAARKAATVTPSSRDSSKDAPRRTSASRRSPIRTTCVAGT
ncbi:unnamed protein product, partial [Amoebophrya sp. A25]